MNQLSKSASCDASKQIHAQPLLQYITEGTEAPIFESGKVLRHTQFHCADAFHLTLRVEGLDAVKHHARSTFYGQVVRTCHDEQQVDASACCIHDERSILVSGICTADSVFKPTLTRPRLGALCPECHCKPRKIRSQKQRENYKPSKQEHLPYQNVEDEKQSETSDLHKRACCNHDEPSILVSGICTAVSVFKLTLTRPRL